MITTELPLELSIVFGRFYGTSPNTTDRSHLERDLTDRKTNQLVRKLLEKWKDSVSCSPMLLEIKNTLDNVESSPERVSEKDLFLERTANNCLLMWATQQPTPRNIEEQLAKNKFGSLANSFFTYPKEFWENKALIKLHWKLGYIPPLTLFGTLVHTAKKSYLEERAQVIDLSISKALHVSSIFREFQDEITEFLINNKKSGFYSIFCYLLWQDIMFELQSGNKDKSAVSFLSTQSIKDLRNYYFTCDRKYNNSILHHPLVLKQCLPMILDKFHLDDLVIVLTPINNKDINPLDRLADNETLEMSSTQWIKLVAAIVKAKNKGCRVNDGLLKLFPSFATNYHTILTEEKDLDFVYKINCIKEMTLEEKKLAISLYIEVHMMEIKDIKKTLSVDDFWSMLPLQNYYQYTDSIDVPPMSWEDEIEFSPIDVCIELPVTETKLLLRHIKIIYQQWNLVDDKNSL